MQTYGSWFTNHDQCRLSFAWKLQKGVSPEHSLVSSRCEVHTWARNIPRPGKPAFWKWIVVYLSPMKGKGFPHLEIRNIEGGVRKWGFISSVGKRTTFLLPLLACYISALFPPVVLSVYSCNLWWNQTMPSKGQPCRPLMETQVFLDAAWVAQKVAVLLPAYYSMDI